jgi:hypothetical protein
MRQLVCLARQRLIVKCTGCIGIEGQVELILPPKIEPGPRDRIVARAGRGMTLRQIGGVRRDFVSDHTHFDVVAIRESQMLLGLDLTEHRCSKPADHCGTNGRGNVIVPGRNIGGERPECVKRGFRTVF